MLTNVRGALSGSYSDNSHQDLVEARRPALLMKWQSAYCPPSVVWITKTSPSTCRSQQKSQSKDYEFINICVMLKNLCKGYRLSHQSKCATAKTLMSPSEILSNKWLNWCRKCLVPIRKKLHVSHRGYHTNCNLVHSACPDSAVLEGILKRPCTV